MNELTVIQETMSSKQIMELLNHGKPKEDHFRHDNIKRTIERLQDRGVIAFTPMEEMVEIGSGAKREMTVYHVNERDSYIVVAQLSPEFTAQLVDHWRQLKGENVELKHLVAEQGRKIDMLCDKLLLLAPSSVGSDTTSLPNSERTGITRKPVYRYNVVEIKALHARGLSKNVIAARTKYSIQTVERVLRGERDYLLQA